MKMFHLLKFGLLLNLITGCAYFTRDQEPANLKIIDAHIHTHFSGDRDEDSGVLDSEESLLDEMKANNVVGAVAHTNRTQSDYKDLKKHNIIHCYGSGAKPDIRKLDIDLKNNKYGCIKIYLGYVRQYPNDPHYLPLYKLAEKYNVPVVFHTGDTYAKDALLKYAEPLSIDEVAVTYPNINFVIAHLGNPWVETAAEVVYKNSNVYADISAFLIGDLSKRSPADIEEYVVKPIRWTFHFCENPKKLMFGTDWSLTHMKPYIEAVKKAIPREHWNDVFYNNAKMVFKFPDGT